MSIYLGNRKIKNVYRGDRQMDNAYQGSRKVYNASSLFPIPSYLRQVSYLEGNFNDTEIALKRSGRGNSVSIYCEFLVNKLRDATSIVVSLGSTITNRLLYFTKTGTNGGVYINNSILFNFALDRKNVIKKETTNHWYLNDEYMARSAIQEDISQIYISRTNGSAHNLRIYDITINDNNGECLLKIVPCVYTSLDNMPCFFNQATGNLILVPDDISWGEE